MSLRSVWSFAVLLGLVVVAASPVSRAAAQPPAGPPSENSPMNLVKGLREQGMSDLALEYLKEIEIDPSVPAEQKTTIPLEKAKCQLEAADDEADEAVRSGLVAEATSGFTDFLRKSPNHPRAAEAAIALARLKSIEAKGQLIKAKKIDVPPGEGDAHDKGVKDQKEAAAKARPLFVKASELFKQGADKLDEQLKGMNVDPNLRKTLEQERFDAELARGINFFALADTYLHAVANEVKERSDNLDAARTIFKELAAKPNVGRTGWVSRAWMAECEHERDKSLDGDKEFAEILKATAFEAEDGKRTVRFFQLRRKFVTSFQAKDLKLVNEAEIACRAWLTQYGANRRARAEATATRYYLGYILQNQAYVSSPLPKDRKTPYKPGGTAIAKLKEAERYYRDIIQSDNEYTDRATRNRMQVVRQIVGEAEQPASSYKSFEEAQMAAIIQISKLTDEERPGPKEEEINAHIAAVGAWFAGKPEPKEDDIKARRMKVVVLLERARVLATDKDSPADVTDVLLQLVYFYEMTDQPHQAAILGEYIARHLKTAGGKSSLAGAMALAGYGMSSSKVPAGADVEKIRQADRVRAIQLARFIDQKYPNDPSTDRARFRLGTLLFEEKDLVGAYDALVKVRPGYDGIVTARLYQGAVASQLLTDPKGGLPDERRVEVFRRTVEDLEKLTAPNSNAAPELVRSYYTARVRLGLLLFLQSRVDAEAEKTTPGFKRAQDVADDLIAQLNGFEKLSTEKKLNLDGWESKLLAEDIRVRASYLRSRLLLDQATDAPSFEAVFAVIGPLLGEMQTQGPFVDQIKEITTAKGEDDPDSSQKVRVSSLAGGVDKLRRELIVIGLKTRVRQGDADKGVELIDMLKKFGGSIEANVGVLEQLSREIGGQIQRLRKENKAAEAKTLADGFAKLLARVSSEPNLSPAVQLFIGQALIAVEDFPGSIAALQKIPAPSDPAWLSLPADQLQMLAEKDRIDTIRYKGTVLSLIRAHRLAGQFDQAENLLTTAVGPKEKPGWAYSSLDFRKETAYLFEARGAAAAPGAPAAKDNYGKALQEWSQVFLIFKTRSEKDAKLKAENDAKNLPSDNQLILRNKNAMYDAFYDVQRCLVKANQKLLAGNAPALEKSLNKVAQSCLDVEKFMGDDLVKDVWEKYADLMDETPQLKQKYTELGGKKFLTHPPQ